jgi:hypothetical protein
VPGPTWVGGSRRPTQGVAAMQAALPDSGDLREANLSLWGVSTLLSRDASGLKRVGLHAPFRAAYVSSARQRKNDPDTMDLESKPFYTRPLLIDAAETSENPTAISAVWTMLSMTVNPLGETTISLPPSLGKGWLYVSDADYPGWEAVVDGKPRKVLRAEGGFRALELAPGEKSVQFLFRPWSFYLGWGISLLMMFFCVYKCFNLQYLR